MWDFVFLMIAFDLAFHYDFYILIGISRVTYCTFREVSKNAFNSGQNVVDKFLKVLNRFLHEIFYICFFFFLQFYGATAKVSGHRFLIPGISRIFLKFPKIISFKTFANSCSNSYILFLVIIILFRFMCLRRFCPRMYKRIFYIFYYFENAWEPQR